ncbi:MAG TPA: exosortase-associated EpsI family protein [Chloroflexota bacterium]|nr:exosortase-associated EpsI family protein [Chloroflexota bacterium]
MHRSSLVRYLLPLVLLASLLLPQARGRASADPPSSTDAWYDMDREAWMHTDDERLVRTKFDLHDGPNLDEVPLQLGPWTGRDVPITNEATFPTLDADRIVYRMYQRSGLRTVIFSMVGASKGQSLHHPLICYQFAGWDTEDRGTTTVPTDDGDVVLRYVIGRDPHGPTQVDLHFFLWPTAGRRWDDGVTQVRITALATVTDEIALDDARAFAALLFAQARHLDDVALTPTPRPTPTPTATVIPEDRTDPAGAEPEEAPGPPSLPPDLPAATATPGATPHAAPDDQAGPLQRVRRELAVAAVPAAPRLAPGLRIPAPSGP